MLDVIQYVTESLDLREHPLRRARKQTRLEYLKVLSYLVNEAVGKGTKNFETNHITDKEQIKLHICGKIIHEKMLADIFEKRFLQYCKALDVENENVKILNEENFMKSLQVMVSRPWRKQHRFCLACDIALILLEKNLFQTALQTVKTVLNNKQSNELDLLVSILLGENIVDTKRFAKVEILIEQYQANRQFLVQPMKKIIVTANMSAGKSTLINALIGKTLARISQEVCTGNIGYFYSKPYEDGNIHLISSGLNFQSNEDEIKRYQQETSISVATYFSHTDESVLRQCIIDTPGVNAALYEEHSRTTKEALKTYVYDKVLYIVSPTNLGTEAEIKHLKWVAENVPKEKIIFVLNKMDDYRNGADSIEESVEGLRMDLENVGYSEPIICPISAYFSLLLKMKITGQAFTEDEQDEYDLFKKKFRRETYDLSRYYENVKCLQGEQEEISLSKKAGIYGLEKIIFGG